MCRELNIANMLDAILPKSQSHHVSHGQALVAMILNGLGFHSRTLHMFSQFFEDKPTERLIGEGIKSEHLNDDVLGRCLDALFAAGVSEIYQVFAEQVVKKLALKVDTVHLEITSFHVDGSYQHDSDDTSVIQLVRGYSRDHRPELNQVILEMITEGQAEVSFYIKALSGNAEDKSAFAKMIKHHLKSLKAAQESTYLVADAALYTTETLVALKQQEQHFVTRVPMTLSEAKQCVNILKPHDMSFVKAGYHGVWHTSQYAGVPQKWLVLSSEQAQKREQVTFDKKRLKINEKEQKQWDKFQKKTFACQSDAEQSFTEWSKTLTFNDVIDVNYESQLSRRAGRPKRDGSTEVQIYSARGQLVENKEKIRISECQLGVFILATSDCSDEMTMEKLLDTYKSQHAVERGFRFLKSPDFMTSSLFLKKPERIEALLMVMTCCLMVYSALEYKIRQNQAKTGRCRAIFSGYEKETDANSDSSLGIFKL